MEAVITSNISLEDSFPRIERLAHRLVDWGDFRIYRRQEGGLQLAYRGQIGRAERWDPTPDTATLREHVTQTGEAVVIDDATRDKRLADAPLAVHGPHTPPPAPTLSPLLPALLAIPLSSFPGTFPPPPRPAGEPRRGMS